MKTFSQFLDEEIKREKLVKLYGVGKRGQTPGRAMSSVVKPAKPFTGIVVVEKYPVGKKKRKNGAISIPRY